MSTTNRAFIKAYRHDTATPVGEPANTTAKSATPARASVSAAVGGNNRPVIGPPGAPSVQNIAERRPLSSYLTQPRTPSKERGDPTHFPTAPAQETPTFTESEPSDKLQAGTAIASFQWPPVCRTLLQQSGTQLDHAARLILSRARAEKSLVGVLGLFPGVGATTTSLCLAARTTAPGRRVVLVDANFSRPRMATLLDAMPTAGWEDFLKHSAPLSDAIIHATEDQLDMLALGSRPVKDPQALVGGLQAAVTAGLLRHAYDLVLVDLGTFFNPASQPILLELTSNMGIDGAIAVTGPEPADPRDVTTIVEHLGRGGCELLGIIENRVAKPKAA